VLRPTFVSAAEGAANPGGFPARLGERPPNLINLDDENPTAFYIWPNVALTLLAPADGCLGDDVVDTTVHGKPLRVAGTVDGFPAGPVDVEIR
jgi:hypothetical protein